MKIDSNSPTKLKAPRDRRGKKAKENELNQVTTDEFEQEGMGVAPKE
jgi:hypothetical protein